MNTRFFRDSSLTFLTGIFIAASCLSIGFLIDGDYRILFIVNMLTFAVGGSIIKKRLLSTPLILGIVLLSIPYAIYYSTQIPVTPRIIVFPILNIIAIVLGYHLKETISKISAGRKIVSYIIIICLSGWFLIPSISTWISVRDSNRKAPKYEITSLSGEKINSTDFEGKIVIVDFWATWCAPCIAEFKELEKFQKHIRNNKDIVLLVINEDEGGDMNLSRQFTTKHDFNLPFYVDSLGRAYTDFEANAYPALYVIDRKSNIRLIKAGFNPSEDLLSILLKKIEEIDLK